MEAESRIAIESDADVVTARQRARELAGELELSSTDQTLLATAISEVARNITTYATRGEVLLRVLRDGNGRRGIEVVASDHGPGIEDIERALQDGYTTGGGLGLGLPGARRLVDEFEIESAPSRARRSGSSCGPERRGRACVRTPPGPPRSSEGRRASRSPARSRSGDLAVWAPTTAARSSRRSTGWGTATRPPTPPRSPRRSSAPTPASSPRSLLKRCHEALRSTRGVVATLAWFDLASGS